MVWTDDADEPGEGTLPDAQPQPVDMFALPQFREFQSKSQLKLNALTAELASRDEELEQLRAEQRTIQDRLDADRLRNATPQQIHAYYQERGQRDAAEQAALTEGQALEQQISTRAGQVLQAVGMNRETAGLRFGSKVDMLSYVDLLESVVEVQARGATAPAEQGTRTEQEAAGAMGIVAQAEPPEPTTQAGPQALPVTRGRVSTARGRKPVSLWGSYFKALDRIPRGDTHAVVSLRMEYQKKGLDFAKMPTRRRR